MRAILAAIVLTTVILANDPPDTLWTIYENNPFMEYAADGVLTQNGCYAYVGTCDSLLSLRIFDSAGNETLSRLYEIPFIEIVYAQSIDQLNDGGFILAGRSSDYCAVFVRTDAVGDTLWTSINPNIYQYSPLTVLATSDGGYVHLFEIPGTVQYETILQLEKYDSSDDLEWETSYDTYFQNSSRWIVEETDGSLVFAGDIADELGYFFVLLVKLNSDGSELWSRTYSSSLCSYVSTNDACRTTDGGYSMVGHYDFNSILLKTDADGNEVWRKEYAGTRALQAITSLGNGDLVAGGFANSFSNAFLFRTDSNGETIWENVLSIPGHNFEYTNDILYDGSTDHYLVSALTAQGINQASDYWIMCYSAITTGFYSEEASGFGSSRISSNHPNPFTQSTVIEYVIEQAAHTDFAIFDLTGHRIRDLYSGYQNEGSFETTWDGCDNNGQRVPGGVYFCRFDSNGSLNGHRMILMNR